MWPSGQESQAEGWQVQKALRWGHRWAWPEGCGNEVIWGHRWAWPEGRGDEVIRGGDAPHGTCKR